MSSRAADEVLRRSDRSILFPESRRAILRKFISKNTLVGKISMDLRFWPFLYGKSAFEALKQSFSYPHAAHRVA